MNGADRHINALAAERRGTAMVSSTEDVNHLDLRSLIDNDKIRVAAEEVRREIEALPTPTDTVARLVHLAGGSPP